MFSYYANSGSVSSGSYLTFNIPMVNNDGNFDGTKFKCPFERNVFYDFSFAGSGYSNEITVIAVKNALLIVVIFFLLKSFPDFVGCIGLHMLFWAHACILILTAFLAFFIMPETHGKTLTELSNLYEKKEEKSKL